MHQLDKYDILLKPFLSRAANRLAISLLSVQDAATYVATGLIDFYFFLLRILIDSSVEEELHNKLYWHL